MKRGRVLPSGESGIRSADVCSRVISSSRISQGLRDVEVLRVEMIPPTNGWNPEGLG